MPEAGQNKKLFNNFQNMFPKQKWKKLKNWQKGAWIGFVSGTIFILLNGLVLFDPEIAQDLRRHALPISGYFAIMITFYVPLFTIVGGLIGFFIKNKK